MYVCMYIYIYIYIYVQLDRNNCISIHPYTGVAMYARVFG